MVSGWWVWVVSGRAPPVSAVIYSAIAPVALQKQKLRVGIEKTTKKKNCFIFSPLLLSPPSIPSTPPPTSLRSLPGPPRHSPIALRPLFCNSCRLQLCTSFLCSLLVRYRYCFSLSASVSLSLSLFLPVLCISSSFLSCWGLLSMLAVAQYVHIIASVSAFICHRASHCTISPLP